MKKSTKLLIILVLLMAALSVVIILCLNTNRSKDELNVSTSSDAYTRYISSSGEIETADDGDENASETVKADVTMSGTESSELAESSEETEFSETTELSNTVTSSESAESTESSEEKKTDTVYMLPGLDITANNSWIRSDKSSASVLILQNKEIQLEITSTSYGEKPYEDLESELVSEYYNDKAVLSISNADYMGYTWSQYATDESILLTAPTGNFLTAVYCTGTGGIITDDIENIINSFEIR